VTEAPEAGPEPGESVSLSASEAALAEVAAEVDALEETVDLTPLDRSRRMLLVHAHPDDESIGTGATMALYSARNALVTLVTCTLGEEGEVVIDELGYLASNSEDKLGQHRIGELAAACEALGVADHRYLGGPGRWRDSGMMGTPENDNPRSFWRADLDEAVLEMVRILREVRPQVVITYDENGGYGHPDHIRAHQVAVGGFQAAGDPAYAPEAGEPWQPAKLYYTAMPKSVIQRGIDRFRESGGDTGFFADIESADDVPFAIDDALVTTEIDGTDFLPAKIAAMRAHRTQIAVDGPFFALADNEGQQAFGVEYYRLIRGQAAPGSEGRENDLFAGLDV
jgi:N-acetyl-1-D-myo-inositol-2-amino-2-deoxy-alpha-D-glucopyranoside deacetylase